MILRKKKVAHTHVHACAHMHIIAARMHTMLKKHTHNGQEQEE